MGAPEFVPPRPARRTRGYSSPPRRPGSWAADRPGDLAGPQPEGERFGSPGPDQGYALTLANHLRDEFHLGEHEHFEDAAAVVASLASRRAAMFGRAPMAEDVRCALAVWGLDGAAAPELQRVRAEMFSEVHHPHYSVRLRAAVDVIDPALLAMSLAAVRAAVSGAPLRGVTV